MKTFFVVVVITAIALTPVLLLVKHFADDETKRLRCALRDERDTWRRMRRIMEKDTERMDEYGFGDSPTSKTKR
jgi:hypothetical protein